MLILPLTMVLLDGTIVFMKRKHLKTLELIFSHPVSANIKWKDIEGLFNSLGAELIEREGSRIEVFLFGQVRRCRHDEFNGY